MSLTLVGYGGYLRVTKVSLLIFNAHSSMATISATQAGDINAVAFLDVIAACCLGITAASASGSGYDTLLVDGEAQATTFPDFGTYPDRNGKPLSAGRYRISRADYARLSAEFSITDFSPRSQDRLALLCLWEEGVMPLIRAGQLHAALDAASHAWPELRVSPLATEKHLWPELVGIYRAAGGTLAIG
ncbi:hypothetical protein [Pandoraea apista]|uniref:hypothetical protein n=1 Tax=Pandoraea apista TaxID=93218 RepID=UPI000F65A43F|nr:hypothetical protein [Pandoraea apista]RRW98955.1 hypothetical protein EGJ56_22555 [Pandoraea apista]